MADDRTEIDMNDQGGAGRWPTDWQHFKWRLRNPWTWPGVFQIGYWWEKRYRPERLQWREGIIVLRNPDLDHQAADAGDDVPAILSPGRSTQLRPGETPVQAMDRLTEGTDL